MLTRKSFYTIIVLGIAIFAILNFLSEKINLRLDFTEDQRYSLSTATEDILSNLSSPITATAYFSENMPPDVERVKDELKDMLLEYAKLSDGMVVFEFINPNENQELEVKAQQAGIRPVMINVREKDQVKQQKAYLGLVLEYEKERDVIPLIQPGTALEYTISSSIKKISSVTKPTVAILQGYGIPNLSEMQQLEKVLSVTHKVEAIEFSDTNGVPQNINNLVIIAPKDSLNFRDINYLDDFAKRGGNLVFAINRVEGILTEAKGESINTGIENWLSKFGINIENSFVIDQNCSNVMVRQQQGVFSINTPVSFPYLPVITNFGIENPISSGLEQVVFPFISPIDFSKADTNLVITPLIVSSEHSGTENPPLYFNINKDWKRADFPSKNLVLGISVEGNLFSVKNKLVIFGDGDFVVNGSGNELQRLQDDNINLMVNAIDWLSDNTGLNTLRTKGITSRPIDKNLDDSTKMLVKYLNFLLPIILILLYGLIRIQSKKKLRKKIAAIRYE